MFLVAAPSKQQSTVRFGHPLADRLDHRRVVSGVRPSTVAETATRVLIGSTGGLHDAIQGEVVDHDDSHRLPPLLSAVLDRRAGKRRTIPLSPAPLDCVARPVPNPYQKAFGALFKPTMRAKW